MDDKIIRLLRDLDRSLRGPMEDDRSPLSEIAELDGEGIPRLIAALGYDDPLVRRMAAYALGQHAPPDRRPSVANKAIPHLERMLQADSNDLVRLFAAEALWNIDENETAIASFIGGTKSTDVEVRRYAVTMLMLVAPEHQNVLAPLTAALGDPDLEVRTTAAGGLAKFGPMAKEAFSGTERLLHEDDEFAKITAIHAILSIDPSRAAELTPRLVAEVKTGSGHSRQRAVQVLGEIPAAGALAIGVLVSLLDDDDEVMRSESLNSLQSPSAAPAVPKLIKILRGLGKDGNDIIVRGAAADALREIGPAAQEAVPHLAKCLLEPLARSWGKYFPLRVAHALWRISREPGYLLAIGLESLRDRNWWIRQTAVARLGDLGAKGEIAIPHLRWMLGDVHPIVRDAAKKALEGIEVTSSSSSERVL